jgi:hypothetical protein
MKVNNVEFEYFIDFDNKKVHLLDSSESIQKTLMNTITPEFQQAVINEMSLSAGLLDFEWLCYSGDGIIASYRDYDVKLVSPKMPYLYKPFQITAADRRNKHKA